VQLYIDGTTIEVLGLESLIGLQAVNGLTEFVEIPKRFSD
jgi:hypothetical protein